MEDGSQLICTTRGIVKTDLTNTSTLVDIPIPDLPPFWEQAASHGVVVTDCLILNGSLMIGTRVGLARYDLAKKELVWVWKVQKR